jgi:hypothetical protein
VVLDYPLSRLLLHKYATLHVEFTCLNWCYQLFNQVHSLLFGERQYNRAKSLFVSCVLIFEPDYILSVFC